MSVDPIDLPWFYLNDGRYGRLGTPHPQHWRDDEYDYIAGLISENV